MQDNNVHLSQGDSQHPNDSTNKAMDTDTEPSNSARQHSCNAAVQYRVAGVLPAVLSLLEGCLEALASDAENSEMAEAGSSQHTVALSDR